VSRVNLRDDSNHVILGTQQFKPTEFATQINLNMDNAWGILRCVIDLCMKQPDGKYLILRDPNKVRISQSLLRINLHQVETRVTAFFTLAKKEVLMISKRIVSQYALGFQSMGIQTLGLRQLF